MLICLRKKCQKWLKLPSIKKTMGAYCMVRTRHNYPQSRKYQPQTPPHYFDTSSMEKTSTTVWKITQQLKKKEDPQNKTYVLHIILSQIKHNTPRPTSFQILNTYNIINNPQKKTKTNLTITPNSSVLTETLTVKSKTNIVNYLIWYFLICIDEKFGERCSKV